MPETKLKWETAVVKKAELRVELDDKVSKDWRHSFEDTVKMLGGGRWGEVTLKKGTVRVQDVATGEEENLRFFLESVVEQANATVTAGTEEPDAESDDEDGEDAVQDDGPDAEMTGRFRSFSSAEHDDQREDAGSD